jgi:putative ABC transport system permease protein
LRRWDLPGTDLTYLLLDEGADPASVQAAIENVARRRLGPELGGMYSFRLRPLKDIYFATYFTENRGELYPGGEYEIVFQLAAIALFILFQAIANFINLATARSADRAREVGVRKTFGAQRGQLIGQFLGESMLVTLAALALSLPIYEFCRIGLANFVPTKEINGIFGSPVALAATLGLVLLTGLAAGLYPALYLSRPQPVTVLRGRGAMQASRPWLRRSLVVFQFALAIVFIVSTVIVYQQARYVSQFDVGFDRDNVLVLKFQGDEAARHCALMKEQVAALSGVVTAVRTNSVLGTRQTASSGFFPTPERREEDMIVAKRFNVGPEFVSMFGLKVVEGRDFAVDRPDDVDRSVLINESMVRELGLTNPIGHRFYRDEGKVFEVVGVVRDFHGSSIDWAYRSMSVITLNPDPCRILNVKLAAGDFSATLEAIRKCWERTVFTQDFEYSFLVDDIQATYQETREMIKLFGVLAVMSIAIACLGILGLVSYTAEQKTKEIGIRKVLGATVPSILALFSKEFLILIAIANVIAWPGAYFLTGGFLSDFAFRVDPGIGTYCLGGALSAIMALGTAGYQSLRAARANPVESLRYE